MLKRKRVYICDHCGAIAPVTQYFQGIPYEGAPAGWTKLGRHEDLCPLCSEIYKRFRNEVIKEKSYDC